jgi:chromate transporter
MTVGLVAASAALIAAATSTHWGLAAITAATAAAMLWTKLHPLWLLGGGALAGLAGAMLG